MIILMCIFSLNIYKTKQMLRLLATLENLNCFIKEDLWDTEFVNAYNIDLSATEMRCPS